MKKAILAFILALLVPASLLADNTLNKRARMQNRINAQTLGASRSFEIEQPSMQGMGVWGLLLVWVAVTDADDGEVGVSLSCTASEDNNTTDFRIPACVWSTANTRYDCEAGPLFWNPSDETTGGTKRQLLRYDIEGIEDIECTFAFTTGSASDTISVWTSYAIKG